jgi:hypothetical protein
LAGMIYVGSGSAKNPETGEWELCSLTIGSTTGRGFKAQSSALRAGMRIMETRREQDISVTFCERTSTWYWRPTHRKLWSKAIEKVR